MDPEPIGPTLVDSVPADPAPEADTAAPSPEAQVPEAVAEAPKADAPAEPALYELPDGRKVDGEILLREWKDNFLPDYTRKSQKLAEIEKPQHINNGENIPDWQKPDYVPQTYAEIVEIATNRAMEKIEQKTVAEQERSRAIADEVERTVSELKAADATLDENSLFQHANKYGFRDLKAAYTNMRDMRAVVKDTESRVMNNLKTRSSDPVAAATVNTDGSVDPSAIANFRSAQEFFSHIKG